MKWGLIGFYGFGNIGDELMLNILVDNIYEIDSAAQILVFLAKDRKVGNTVDDRITYISPKHAIHQISNIKRIDCLIWGGGTCLNNYGFCAVYHFVIAKLLRKKTALLNIGAEPVSLIKSRFFAKLLLACIDQVVVRDQNSFEIIKSISPSKECTLSHDLVFLEYKDVQPVKPHQTNLLISWFEFTAFVGNKVEFITPLSIAIENFVKSNNIERIEVLNIAGDIDIEANTLLYQTLLEKFKGRVTYFQGLTIQQQLDKIRNASFYLSGRLHGFMLGKLNRIPCVGYAYAPKIQIFSQYLSKSNILKKQLLEENKVEEISAIMDNEYKVPASFISDVSDIKEKTKMGLQNFLIKLCKKIQ